MTPEEQSTLWIGATRYYIGRMTYAVRDFCSLLIKAWSELNPHAQAIIKRDVEDAFERDDVVRAGKMKGHGYLALGMDVDRRCWESVRTLWKDGD